MATMNEYRRVKNFFKKYGRLPQIPMELLREMIDAAPKKSALEKALVQRRYASQ